MVFENWKRFQEKISRKLLPISWKLLVLVNSKKFDQRIQGFLLEIYFERGLSKTL